MNLPQSGWTGYGAPGHPYSRCLAIADQLRKAAVLSDDAGHPLREVAYLRWLADHPEVPDEVSLALETALIPYR